MESVGLARLASGSRIVNASDDAAGLAIGAQLQAGIASYQQDSVNVQQGSTILKTTDGALAQIDNLLQRMMSLASESGSGQVTNSQRTQDIQTEYGQLTAEISSIISSTRFAGQQLLTGSFLSNTSFLTGTTSSDSIALSLSAISLISLLGLGTTNIQATVTIASGANAGTYGQYSDANGNILLSGLGQGTFASSGILTFIDANGGTAYNSNNASYISSTHAQQILMQPAIGLSGNFTKVMVGSGLSVATSTDAFYAIEALGSAINGISQERAKVGAYESRFSFSEQNIATNILSLTAAQSVIADADVASEKSRLSSSDILTRSSIAALTQASSLPQELLRLIQ